MNSFSVHAGILTGLILYRPCAYSYNYCEFMCVTVLVSQHFIIKLLKYLTRVTFQSNLQASTKTKSREDLVLHVFTLLSSGTDVVNFREYCQAHRKGNILIYSHWIQLLLSVLDFVIVAMLVGIW